jgi:hypothetical protein
MKILCRLFVVFTLGCAASAFADEAYPSLYSFADVYRLTVSAAPDALTLVTPSAAPQFHLAAAMQDAFVAAEPRFTVSQAPGSPGWVLLLAGLAAAGWVAHRRLTSAY